MKVRECAKVVVVLSISFLSEGSHELIAVSFHDEVDERRRKKSSVQSYIVRMASRAGQVADKAINYLSTLLVGKTTLFHGMIAVNERTAKESSKLFFPEKREKKIRRQSKQKQSRKLGNQAINDILTDRWAGARLNIHFQLGRYVSTDVLT